MAATPATRARPTGRGPMAHRAPAGRNRPAEAARRALPGPIAAALSDEAAELTRLARRIIPTRRAALLVGLALLALVAFGGIAGAAEPEPAQRSALEAFAATAEPAATRTANGAAVEPSLVPGFGVAGAAASPAAGVAASASSAVSLTTPAALADDPALQGPDLLDLGAKTLLVVVLLLVTLRVLRRVQGANPARASGQLAVLESRPLGPKTQLHLIAVGDRRLVIGQSPSGLVALGELDAAELPVPEPVREPWARRDALDADPELETQLAHELATGRRPRLGVSA
jgi:flagellar biogenesis protein FliO